MPLVAEFLISKRQDLMKFHKTMISSALPGYEIGYSLLNAYPANAHGIID